MSPLRAVAGGGGDLDGVVAKRLGSRYRPGARGPDWVKVRFLRRGEFVSIVGPLMSLLLS